MNQKPVPVIKESIPKVDYPFHTIKTPEDLSRALKIVDAKWDSYAASFKDIATGIEETLVKLRKVVPPNKDDERKLEHIFNVYIMWTVERSKIYNSYVWQKKLTFEENEKAIIHYYSDIIHNLVYLVMKQTYFRKEFLAFQCGMRMRQAIVKEIQKLQTDPRCTGTAIRPDQSNVRQYKKWITFLANTLIAGNHISKDYYDKLPKSPDMAYHLKCEDVRLYSNPEAGNICLPS